MMVLEYFDPIVTSHIQPLGMGIIRSEKAYYRKDIVLENLKRMERSLYQHLKKLSKWSKIRVGQCIH